MSKFSKTDLAANPALQKLIAPSELAALGIVPPPSANSPLTSTESSTTPTLKGTWDNLSKEAKRRLRGDEARQHAILENWLRKHQIPFIHAPTSRKVHDLPPGWPDFTIFRKIKNFANHTREQTVPATQCLLLEMKVPGGQLSWEQKHWAKILHIRYIPSALAGIRLAADFCQIDLPVLAHQDPLLLYGDQDEPAIQ